MLKSITSANIAAGSLVLLSGAGLGLIVTELDPASAFNLILLYLDIFAITGSITFLLGLFARQSFGQREFVSRHILISARQSLWFGLLVVISMILLSAGMFTWWNGILLMLCLIFLESYYLFK